MSLLTINQFNLVFCFTLILSGGTPLIGQNVKMNPQISQEKYDQLEDIVSKVFRPTGDVGFIYDLKDMYKLGFKK